MPLLKRKPFKRNSIPDGLRDDDEVYYCEQTNEVFKNYDEFFERCMLTNSVIWQCGLTGRPDLTFAEALESEKTARKLLRQFPSALRSPVIYVASQTKRSALKELVDDVFNIIKDRYFVDEKIDVMNESGRGCRFCKIIEVIPPEGYESSKEYDLSKVEYRVEAVDDEKEPQVWVTKPSHLRRDKTLFSKEKTKLFLKQNVEGSNAMLVVKAESVKKYVDDRNFNPKVSIIGKLPDFEVSKKIQLWQEKSNKKKENAKEGKSGKKNSKQGDITKYLNNSGSKQAKELTAEQKKERDEKSKKFREEMEAKRKEKAEREAEKQKNIQLEKQRLLAKTQATVRELNQLRDDLELTDHRIIPKGKEISTIIDKKYFSDFIKILEFLHSFPEVLSISDKFPYGINMDLLERALILKEVNGPLSDILQVLLSTIFSLQIEEENEIDIVYRVNGDVPQNHSKVELMKNASKLHRWVENHYHMKLNMLVLDSPTLSELLRLHFLSSGAALQEKSSKARFQARGGYKSSDDPGLTFVSKYSHIIKFLSQQSVFQLPTRDILRIMNCLIDQILTYSNLRDIIEERLEKSANARLEFRRIKADEGKRERKVADDKKTLLEEHKNVIAAYEGKEQSAKEALIKQAEAELENKMAKIDWLSNKERAIYLKDLKAQVSVFFNHQTYLGSDRAFRNYYIFESIPGLFVEQDFTNSGKCMDDFVKNNPALAHCTKEQRYGIIKQMVANEENIASPGDHDKENKIDVNGAMNSTENKLSKKESDVELQNELLMCNCDPSTCSVHSERAERSVWSYYHTAEEIDSLIESLNSRGYRETKLREQLESNHDLIVDYIKNCPIPKLSFNAEEIPDIIAEVKKAARSGKNKKYDDPNLGQSSGTDPNITYDAYLRQQLLEFEYKLSAGCLGQVKVSDRVLWRKYIEEGEYYALDDNLKWGRAAIPNGIANGHVKAGGSSKGSEKQEEESDDDFSDTISSVGDIEFTHAVDSGHCSDMETDEVEEKIHIKTSEVEAVKLKSKNLAMTLLQIEQGIEIKFIRAPFGPIKDKKDKQAMAEAFETSKKKLYKWEESLMKSTNYSQVFLHFNILYDSIKWSQSAERIGCLVCRSKQNPEQTLLCDECNKGWHMYCLKPKLTDIPTGDWFCPRCRPENYIIKRNKKRRAVVVESESEEEEEETEAGDNDDSNDSADDTMSKIDTCTNCAYEGEQSEFIFCSECPTRCHYECAKPQPKSERTKKWKCQKCINAEKRNERVKRRRMEKDYDSADEEKNSESGEDEPEEPVKQKGRRSKRVLEDSDDSETEAKVSKLNDGRRVSNRRASNRNSRKNSPEPAERPNRRSLKKAEEIKDRRSSKRSIDVNFNMNILGTLIDEIIKHNESWAFLNPVKPSEVPDYHEVIKHPMDFSKIKSKLNLGDYNTNEQVMKDMQLVFFNCDLYNLSNSEIYKSGSKLEKFVAKRAKELNLPFRLSDMNSS